MKLRDLTKVGCKQGNWIIMKILVVDDDRELCSMLAQYFRQHEFDIACESEGNRGLSRAVADQFDLLILDVMLPGLDGFEALRELRKKSQIPVLMLTARGERGERILGLEMGADDYLSKPFDPEELMARVRAILRRVAISTTTKAEPLQVGDLRLLPGSRDAYFRGEKIGLTAMECEVLEQLMRAPGHVVSRDQLAIRLYNRPATVFDRSVDTHISRIRRKLRDGRVMIVSVRGTGYQLCDSSETG